MSALHASAHHGVRTPQVGRLKLAYALSTPFLERVEFPNEWYLCEEYDLGNDGWQSAASLELEIVWGKEVATIVVQPWLAYSTSIGARVILRKVITSLITSLITLASVLNLDWSSRHPSEGGLMASECIP